MITRRIFFWAILLCVGVSGLVSGQDNNSSVEVLTNDKVVAMVKAGLPPSVVVSKIRTSKSNFNTNTEELIRLQQSQVPTEIINAMVEASSHTSATSSSLGAGDVLKTDPNDPASAHEAGIYLFEEKDGQRKMTQLEPSISKQTKSGGFLTSALTYGVAKIKFRAALAGANATLQLTTPRPVFYFYFEAKNAGLSTSSYYATNPNEFVLVQFNTKSNGREVTVSQQNVFGGQSGAMDKSSRAFKSEKLAAGVYKVTPEIDLADGEYGFYNAAGSGGPSGGAKIFDFGIKRPR